MSEYEKWKQNEAEARLREAAQRLLAACKAFVAARTNDELHAAVKAAEAAIKAAERSEG